MGEGLAPREALALGVAVWDTGDPCTGAVHARVQGEKGRALWRIVVALDGHHQGMHSTYLTATVCTPPSPVSQIAHGWYCSGSDG